MTKNKKSLASRLNNRLEIWGNIKVDTDLGTAPEKQLIKKIWADIKPLYGSKKGGPAETIANSVNFRVVIRKTEITSANWIMYRETRYDISHIMPGFKDNKYLDIEVYVDGE